MSRQNNNPTTQRFDSNNTGHARDAAKSSGTSPPNARSDNHLLCAVLRAYPRWMYEQAELSSDDRHSDFAVNLFGARISAVQRALERIGLSDHGIRRLVGETRARLIELAAYAVLEAGFENDDDFYPCSITDVLDAEEE